MIKILLYNLNNETGKRIRTLCLQLGVKACDVPVSDYLVPIAALAGIMKKGNNVQTFQGVPFTDEMMVFCGFNDKELDKFLSEYRKARIPFIPLKAGLTPTNAVWNSLQLHQAISQEHDEMSIAKKS